LLFSATLNLHTIYRTGTQRKPTTVMTWNCIQLMPSIMMLLILLRA